MDFEVIESRAMETNQVASLPSDCSTREVARVLGMAVRSVQLMVDRGELEAWKTPGGHRRIARASVERWLNQRHGHAAVPSAAISANEVAVVPDEASAKASTKRALQGGGRKDPAHAQRQRVLLIEDSVHFQTLVKLLMAHDFPQIDLHVADDGIVG